MQLVSCWTVQAPSEGLIQVTAQKGKRKRDPRDGGGGPGGRGGDWPGGTARFTRFVLHKENMDTQVWQSCVLCHLCLGMRCGPTTLQRPPCSRARHSATLSAPQDASAVCVDVCFGWPVEGEACPSTAAGGAVAAVAHAALLAGRLWVCGHQGQARGGRPRLTHGCTCDVGCAVS